MQTVGGAAVGVGIGLGILVAGFFVSNITLSRAATVAASTSSPAAAAVTAPLARSAIPASATSTAAGTRAATAAPTATATPAPAATADPIVVTGYTGQGLRLAALTIPSGYTVTSPIAGKVTVVVYQFIDGEIRSGADAAGVPKFPYIFIRSADREIKLRPGALDRDVQLLVKDGDTIAAGAPLFKTVTTGASSWKTFYDAAVNAQVMVSVTAQPAGTELDPVPLYKR
jgi:biotin carboxyl carrier protein